VEAEQQGRGPVVYLATSRAGDDEMRRRIEEHRRHRPQHWSTVEAPLQVATALLQAGEDNGLVLLDCLTLLISNLLTEERDTSLAGQKIEAEMERLAAAARETKAEVLIVSNEVGLGVVPPSVLGRLFRDYTGRAHQLLAEQADKVFFLVAGIPQQLK
jgi:adenosylcobinamide kinase/adenosylcobinamide-phosphate guanylyltransferase